MLEDLSVHGMPSYESPHADMMEPGLSYLPKGAGCTSQPEWAKNASSSTPAIQYNSSSWNGFCQSGWTACPDAVANKDYSYYWRSLGAEWVQFAGAVDGEYCRKNGWLTPKYRAIYKDFEALKTAADEECKMKWSKPEYQLDNVGLDGVSTAIQQSMKDSVRDVKENGVLTSLRTMSLGRLMMSETGAGIAAAWNCAMGSVACDIAYCNHAYCDTGDGTFGIMDECDRWDLKRGMPQLSA